MAISLHYGVTGANYRSRRDHWQDSYVNSCGQSELINFFVAAAHPLNTSIYKTPTSSTGGTRTKSTTSVVLSFVSSVQCHCCTCLSLKSNSLDLCVCVCVWIDRTNTIGSNIDVEGTLSWSMWERRWIVTHTHTRRYMPRHLHNCKKKIARQMWSSKVRAELVTPSASARHIARLTWSVHSSGCWHEKRNHPCRCIRHTTKQTREELHSIATSFCIQKWPSPHSATWYLHDNLISRTSACIEIIRLLFAFSSSSSSSFFFSFYSIGLIQHSLRVFICLEKNSRWDVNII